MTAHSSTYRPESVALKADVPTTWVVRPDGAAGCVTAFVILALNKQ